MRKNVGEALARAEQSEEPEEGAEEEAPEETEEDAPVEVVTKVKTTDVVNIRTSTARRRISLARQLWAMNLSFWKKKATVGARLSMTAERHISRAIFWSLPKP